MSVKQIVQTVLLVALWFLSAGVWFVVAMWQNQPVFCAPGVFFFLVGLVNLYYWGKQREVKKK